MLFFGCNVLYMFRVNMSIAMVAMVNQTAVLAAATEGIDKLGTAVCQLDNANASTNQTAAVPKYVRPQ